MVLYYRCREEGAKLNFASEWEGKSLGFFFWTYVLLHIVLPGSDCAMA